MEEQETTEPRILKRRHLIYYLEVHDGKSGSLLGHLVDLTTKGVKLVSREPIATDTELTLKMMLPDEYSEEKFVSFKAKSIWSGKDVNPDFYATGFIAPDLSKDVKDIFKSLIDEAGFND